jgi:hypothetical protein
MVATLSNIFLKISELQFSLHTSMNIHGAGGQKYSQCRESHLKSRDIRPCSNVRISLIKRIVNLTTYVLLRSGTSSLTLRSRS